MVVLIAALLALQSVVITPTTGGAVDRTVQDQLQQEASDALVVAESHGGLTATVMGWSGNATDNVSAFEENASLSHELGPILEHRFSEQGHSYNLEAVYVEENGTVTVDRVLTQGRPSSGAVTASYTITLFDDHEHIPEHTDPTLEHAYAVVEVRLTVW